jgi:hypothetical protein
MSKNVFRDLTEDKRGFSFPAFMIILSVIGVSIICLQNERNTSIRALKKTAAAGKAQAAYIAAQAYIRETIAKGGTVDADADWETVLAPYTIKVPVSGALRIWLNDTRTDVKLVQWQDGWEGAKDIGGWHVTVADYPPGSYPRGYFQDTYGSEGAAAAVENAKREKRLLRLAASGRAIDGGGTSDPDNTAGRGAGTAARKAKTKSKR